MTKTLRKFVKNVLNERVRSSAAEEFDQIKKFKFEEFKRLNDVKEVFNYAVKRLEYIAHGSSRATFVLTGNKVLKVAINQAGVAQNEQEIDVFTNPKTKNITTRIYQSHPNYLWLVSETVKPFQDEFELEKFLDLGILHDWQLTFDQFISSAVQGNTDYLNDLTRARHDNSSDLIDLSKSIHDLVDASNIDIGWGDLAKHDSWGRSSDGRFVLLDFGLSGDIVRSFYDNSGRVIEQ